jgi:hypothetical protein
MQIQDHPSVQSLEVKGGQIIDTISNSCTRATSARSRSSKSKHHQAHAARRPTSG